METKHKFTIGGIIFSVLVFLIIIILAILDVIPLIATLILLGSLIGLITVTIMTIYIVKNILNKPVEEEKKEIFPSKKEIIEFARDYITSFFGDNVKFESDYPPMYVGNPGVENPIQRLDFKSEDTYIKYVFICNLKAYKSNYGCKSYKGNIDEEQVEKLIKTSPYSPQATIMKEVHSDVDEFGIPTTKQTVHYPYLPKEEKREEVKEKPKEEQKKEGVE